MQILSFRQLIASVRMYSRGRNITNCHIAAFLNLIINILQTDKVVIYLAQPSPS